MAAVITTEEVAKTFLSTKVEYFNTFGGNPVRYTQWKELVILCQKGPL